MQTSFKQTSSSFLAPFVSWLHQNRADKATNSECFIVEVMAPRFGCIPQSLVSMGKQTAHVRGINV